MDQADFALLSAREIIIHANRYFYMISGKAEEISNNLNDVTDHIKKIKSDPYNKALLHNASRIALNSRNRITNNRNCVVSLKKMTQKIFEGNTRNPINALNMLLNINETELYRLRVISGIGNNIPTRLV